MDSILSNSTSLIIASLPPFPPLTTTHLTTLPATTTVHNRRRRRLQLSRKSVSSFPPPPPPLLAVRKTAITCGAIPEINQSQFSDTVLKSDRPVLVEFVATWCGPCRLISPAMESVAQEYSDRLVVVKIDCDANPELIEEYKVYGLPALILFKNGQEVSGSRREGAITKAKLKEYLDSLLEAISVA